jgi:hypothetical protein
MIVLLKNFNIGRQSFVPIRRKVCPGAIKNILAMVMSRNEGTFLIGRLMTSLKWSAVSKKVNITIINIFYT